MGDFNKAPVGYLMVAQNKALIDRAFTLAVGSSSAGVTVLGHSLAGPMAQLSALQHKDVVRECVTFDAPGIEAADARKLEASVPDNFKSSVSRRGFHA